MTLMKHLFGAAATLALTAGVASADPAIIFDLGGKFDKSFNEAAFNGAEKWAKETGGTYKELEMQDEAQREQALRRLAEAGASPEALNQRLRALLQRPPQPGALQQLKNFFKESWGALASWKTVHWHLRAESSATQHAVEQLDGLFLVHVLMAVGVGHGLVGGIR